MQSTVSDTVRWFKCTGANKDRKTNGRPCKKIQVQLYSHVNEIDD